MTPTNIAALFGLDETEKTQTPMAAERLGRPRNRVASMSGVGAVTLSDYLRARRRGGDPAASNDSPND